jgi:hypothetical protein
MEKRYWLWFFTISLTVGLGLIIGYLVAHTYFSDLETRLQMLESQYASSLRSGQEIKLDEVKILISKSEEAIKNNCFILTVLGLPFTAIALLSSLFAAFKWAATIAKEEAEKVFEDPDKFFKEDKSILVITPDGDDENWLRKFFQLMNFKAPTFKKKSEIETVKDKSFDLVILNAPSDLARQPSAHNALLGQMTMAKSVFYFGPGQVSNEALDKFGKLSFANAKSQLYGNLINALKFQKIL